MGVAKNSTIAQALREEFPLLWEDVQHAVTDERLGNPVAAICEEAARALHELWLARSSAGLVVPADTIEKAHEAVDFIVADATITPDGCPEPWRSTLIEWFEAAKRARDVLAAVRAPKEET